MSDKITLVLKNHDVISNLDSCPLINEEKTIKLFRWCMNDPIKEIDFLPLALENPCRTFPNHLMCLSWGLSTYDSLEATKNAVKIFSKKKRNQLKAIVSIKIDKSMAVKHQSGVNENHYTVYPYENADLFTCFSKEII